MNKRRCCDIKWHPLAHCPYCNRRMLWSESEPDEFQGKYAHRKCQEEALYAVVAQIRAQRTDPNKGEQHRYPARQSRIR